MDMNLEGKHYSVLLRNKNGFFSIIAILSPFLFSTYTCYFYAWKKQTNKTMQPPLPIKFALLVFGEVPSSVLEHMEKVSHAKHGDVCWESPYISPGSAGETGNNTGCDTWGKVWAFLLKPK